MLNTEEHDSSLHTPVIPKRLEFSSLVKVLPLLVLCTSLILSFVLWWVLDQSFRQKAKVAYLATTEDITERIIKRLHDHEQVLLGGVGLFNVEPDVKRMDWLHYVSSLKLDQNMPGIQGVGFSAWLTPAEKEAHIRSIRAEGFHEYRIKPEGNRPVYTAIIYLEPFNWRNQRAFGYDMYSEATRREAMDKARDGGMTTIAAKITLVQETDKDKQTGMLMYAPVYRLGMATDSVEQRRKALRGFVYSPIRMNDFVYGTLGKLPQEVAFDLYADESEKGGSLLFSSIKAEKIALPDAFTPDFTSRATIDAYGRKWTFSYKSLPSFEKRLEKGKSYTILGISIMASLLLSGISFLLMNIRNRALDLAQEMTRELRESRALFQSVIEATSDCIFVKDLEGKYLLANSAALRFLGKTAAEVIGRSDGDIFPADTARLVMESDRQAISDGRIISEEYPMKSSLGVMHHMSIIKGPLLNAEGEISGVFGITRDISDRKLTEETLRKSEERIRLLLNSTAEGIYGMDQEGRCTFANPSALRILGYTDQQQLLGKNLHWLVHHSYPEGKHYPVEDCSILQALRQGSGMHRDDEFLWKADGTSFPAEYWSYPQVVDGIVTGAVVTFNDISERKEAEKVQQTLNSELERRVEERTAELKDAERKIIRVNRLYAVLTRTNEAVNRIREPLQLFDYVCHNAVEVGLFRMAWIGEVDPVTLSVKPVVRYGYDEGYIDSLDISIAARTRTGGGPVGQALRQNRCIVNDDTENNPAMIPWRGEMLKRGFLSSASFPLSIDGVLYGCINFYAAEVHFFNEEVMQLLSTLQDDLSFALEFMQHQERHQKAQDALRESEKLLSTIFETEPESVALLTSDGSILMINGAGLEMLQVEPAGQLEGRSFYNFIDPAHLDSFKALIEDVFRGESGFLEFEVIGERGRRRWLDIHAVPLRNETGEIVSLLGISRNITERKEMDRMKDEMISAVSHEMRTPLTAMSGYIEFILENDVDVVQAREYLGIVHKETERLKKLIGDFLDMQRFKAKRGGHVFKPVAVMPLLQETATLFNSSNTHRISIDTDAELPLILGNEEDLRAVFNNLLSNAVKFSPQGGNIVVGASHDDASITVWVKDEGVGIPGEEQDKIFDRFYRVDNTPRRATGGTGLGLAIIREIVVAHGGRVWVESAAGQGSTFYVSLPVMKHASR